MKNLFPHAATLVLGLGLWTSTAAAGPIGPALMDPGEAAGTSEPKKTGLERRRMTRSKAERSRIKQVDHAKGTNVSRALRKGSLSPTTDTPLSAPTRGRSMAPVPSERESQGGGY